MLLLPAGDLISRPPETKASFPLSISVASKASNLTDAVDFDEDEEDERSSPKNIFREAKNPVMAEASLMTSKAAEIGATKGPDVNASSVICGM